MEYRTFTVVDPAGNAVRNATVYVYEVNTTTEASIYDESETARTQPLQTDARGQVSFVAPNGVYDVNVSSTAASYTLENVRFFDPSDARFATRAALVSAWSDGDQPDGTVVTDGTVSYVAQSGATDISDLPGLVPYGDVWLEHFGVVTSTDRTAPTTDYTSEVQAAMDYTRGTLHFSGWVKITDQVTCPNTCTLHCPAGRTYGGFSVFSDFNGAATCVLQPGTSEAGATIGHLGMWFEQPSAPANRAELNSYPPAIDIGTTQIPRGYIEALRIEQATDGIKGVGNCGGYRFGVLELGCFGDNLHIDGAQDFVHADSIHVWPFGFAGNSTLKDIFYDGTPTALKLGEVDNWVCDKCSTFQVRIDLADTGGSARQPYQFNQIGMDGNSATLTLGAGDTLINNFSSIKTSAASSPDITVTDGRHRIATCSISSQNNPCILVTGGSLDIEGGRLRNSSNVEYAARVSGGFLALRNMTFEWEESSRTVPFVEQKSGGTLVVYNCTSTVTGTPGEVIEIEADVKGNYIDAISLHPHTVTIAGSEPFEGRYYLDENFYSSWSRIIDSRVVADDTAGGPQYSFKRAKGSVGSPTAVGNGDILGTLDFQGWDGDSFEMAVRLRAISVGTISDGVVRGRLLVAVADDSGGLQTPLTVDFDRVTVTNGDMNVSSGGVYRIGGTKVLDSQQSAISDVPTGGSATAGDNATAINSILSALRAHGLIAT